MLNTLVVAINVIDVLGGSQRVHPAEGIRGWSGDKRERERERERGLLFSELELAQAPTCALDCINDALQILVADCALHVGRPQSYFKSGI